MKYLKQSLLFIAVAVVLCSCKKLVTVGMPDSQLISSSVYSDSVTAQSAMAGIYSVLYNGSGSGSGFYSQGITQFPSRSADEMYTVQSSTDEFATNSLLDNNTYVNQLWSHSYNIIYNANSIIEGAAASGSLSASLKQQMTGEAKFIRALMHFYLVNYFGDVPVITTTSVTVNGKLARTPAATVYQQIITDLTDARNTLAADYSWSQGNRARANTWAASALLARVYLYQGNWALAETEASRVIAQASLFSILTDPNAVFLKNSNETILAFYTNSAGYTWIASQTVLTGLALPTYAMRAEQVAAFEAGDTRSTKWVGSVTYAGNTYKFPYKYKATTNTNTEYDIVLRLSEQYLIRAEARMQQNNVAGAQSDLNVIRNRAGLANTTAADKASLATAIEHERQVELFYEWGHRWLDLKRTGRADVVLRAEKPAGWQTTDVLYPIPVTAINTNPALVQNPGY